MKSFVLALSFFTRIPFLKVDFDENVFAKAIKWSPIVGLIIGVFLFAISFILKDFDKIVVNIIIVVAYIIITGGLHLDGLSDTFDGIFSGRDKDRILEIMRDSRVGTYGVLSLVIWTASMLIILFFLPREVLIIFPVIGKSAPIISAFFADYVRSQGLGKIFADNSKRVELTIALIVSIGISCILGYVGVLSTLVALTSVYLFTLYLKKIIGGITGDTMGCVCEISQLCFLFSVYFIQGATS